MTVRDDLAITALARALVRTGMYVDAGIDTSAGLDNPRAYAAAILNDPDLAADGLHFVMVETLERIAALAATPTASPTAPTHVHEWEAWDSTDPNESWFACVSGCSSIVRRRLASPTATGEREA